MPAVHIVEGIFGRRNNEGLGEKHVVLLEKQIIVIGLHSSV